MTENEIGTIILDAAFEVHKNLGPGLLESSYEHSLAYELSQRGLQLNTQAPLPLTYKEVRMECGYRVDLFVENKVIVEVKAVEAFNEVHLAQLLTYLKLTRCKLGYLINFNVLQLKSGIKRVANGL